MTLAYGTPPRHRRATKPVSVMGDHDMSSRASCIWGGDPNTDCTDNACPRHAPGKHKGPSETQFLSMQ